MNEAPADSPLFAPSTPSRGVPRRKLILLILLALAAHLAFLFAFGTSQPIAPRAVTNAPHWRLLAPESELVALNDPTLFARPHAHDFVTAYWQHVPVNPPPTFHWVAPADWLPLTAAKLGDTFRQFMQTNRFETAKLNFKLPPKLSEVTVPFDNGLPQISTMQRLGDLAERRLINPPELPSLAINEVLPPSQVQVLVDETGNVISAVLIAADNPLEAAARNNPADQEALKQARQLRFAPATRPMFGHLRFYWHTVPTNSP